MARILVVDDYADFREVVRLLLERQGHEVLEAEDGIEAVQVCRNSHPDLVILDIFMPGKDGIETLWEIREQRTARRVIAVSAGRTAQWAPKNVDVSEILDLAGDFGADMTLTKPLEPSELLSAVDKTLGGGPP